MLRKLHTEEQVRRMEPFPRGYGTAYYDHRSNHWVMYPVPINLLVRAGRVALYHYNMMRHPRLGNDLRENLELQRRAAIEAQRELYKTRELVDQMQLHIRELERELAIARQTSSRREETLEEVLSAMAEAHKMVRRFRSLYYSEKIAAEARGDNPDEVRISYTDLESAGIWPSWVHRSHNIVWRGGFRPTANENEWMEIIVRELL